MLLVHVQSPWDGLDAGLRCQWAGIYLVRPNVKLVLVIGRVGYGVEGSRRAAQSESRTVASPNPVMKSFSAYMHFRLQQRNKGGKEYVPAHHLFQRISRLRIMQSKQPDRQINLAIDVVMSKSAS